MILELKGLSNCNAHLKKNQASTGVVNRTGQLFIRRLFHLFLLTHNLFGNPSKL